MKNKLRFNHRIHRLVIKTFVLNTENKQFADHIDNNKTNNQLKNLRWATINENLGNATLSKTNTSGVKGVSYQKSSKKWHARITIDGIVINLGFYDNLEEAKQARQIKAYQAFGVFVNQAS